MFVWTQAIVDCSRFLDPYMTLEKAKAAAEAEARAKNKKSKKKNTNPAAAAQVCTALVYRSAL